MELFFCLFVVEFNIKTSIQKIFLNLFSLRFIAIFIAINHYGNALGDSAQKVESFDPDIVIDNRDRLLRHTVNLRIGNICIQLLPVQNQEMLESRRINEIFHNLLKIGLNDCDILGIPLRLHGNLCNAVVTQQIPVFGDDVVLHLLKKPNKSFALRRSTLTLKNRHEHVDALFSEGIRSVPRTTPT